MEKYGQVTPGRHKGTRTHTGDSDGLNESLICTSKGNIENSIGDLLRPSAEGLATRLILLYQMCKNTLKVSVLRVHSLTHSRIPLFYSP